MKRLIRIPKLTLYPFTVGLLGPDGLSVRLYYVQGKQPLDAYRQALTEAGCEPLTLEEGMTDWPLLFVLEGHVPFEPVLTGSQVNL